MHPSIHAVTHPDKPAYIMAATGETVTYKELDDRSNQGAQLFRKMGLKTGDVIAIMLENHPRYFELAWAAQRSGLYYACISSKLSASEVEYIVKDCGAKVFITSAGLGAIVDEMPALIPGVKLYQVGDAKAPYDSFEADRGAMPTSRISDEAQGSDMLYSSGTTGRPKGVKPKLTADAPIDAPLGLVSIANGLFGINQDSIYLSPAPLYHAAPLRWCMSVNRLGGTVIVMKNSMPKTLWP